MIRRFIAIACFIVSLCVFNACALNHNATKEIPKPTISINSVKLAAVTLDSVFLNTNVDIVNPYPIDVPISDVVVNIYYQNKIISNYKIDGKSTLKSLSKSTLLLESSVKILDLVKLVSNYRELESIDLTIEVAAMLPLPKVLGENFALKERFDVSIPTINPAVSLKDIQYNLPNLTFVLHIRNRSKTPLLLDDVAYSLKIDKHDIKGIARSVPNSDGSLNLNIDLNILSIISNFSLDLAKNAEIDISSALRVDGIPYKIPLDLHFKR